MRAECFESDVNKTIRLLRLFASTKDLDKTKRLHSCIIESGVDAFLPVRSALIHAYVKSGSLENSDIVFAHFADRDVILWTALIAGYSQRGLGTQALSLCRQMLVEGIPLNNFTFSSVIKACSALPYLIVGKQMHASLIEAGYGTDVTVRNVLIDMYAKSDKIEQAFVVFNQMHEKDAVSWSAMIGGCVNTENCQKAFELFCEMHQKLFVPNNYIYLSILKAYASIKALEGTRHVHSQTVEQGWDSDLFVRSALVDTYVKCGSLRDGKEVTDKMYDPDIVSCNAMLDGYAHNACFDEAWMLYMAMLHRAVFPDKVTYASILKACASKNSLQRGKQIHAQIIESVIECDLFIASSLVDMYVKCKQLVDAHRVFDGVLVRDVVLWNCLLGGYAEKQDFGKEAISLFIQMIQEGISADLVTYLIALKACAEIVSLRWGKQVHSRLVGETFKTNTIVRSSLVVMYAKCGSITMAREVFDSIQERDVVAWNAMISAYAQRGMNKEVFRLLEVMQKEFLEPSEVTLGCVLSACRHSGLVEDGCKYLVTLGLRYGIEPTAEHFGCIIDLFARAGRLDEAAGFLVNLPFEHRIEPCIALLGACKTHGNVDAGERAFNHIEHVEPMHVSAMVLLSNVYAAAKMWDSVKSTRHKLWDISTNGHLM